MSLFVKIYNATLKRSSVFAITIVAGTFFFERTIDLMNNIFFETVNKGKLWKDIKHKYQN